MLFKKILKRIKSIFHYPRYYNEKYGWYSIIDTKFRTDYWKADVLIIADDRMWYWVSYDWLIDNSIDEDGRPAKRNKWV